MKKEVNKMMKLELVLYIVISIFYIIEAFNKHLGIYIIAIMWLWLAFYNQYLFIKRNEEITKLKNRNFELWYELAELKNNRSEKDDNN